MKGRYYTRAVCLLYGAFIAGAVGIASSQISSTGDCTATNSARQVPKTPAGKADTNSQGSLWVPRRPTWNGVQFSLPSEVIVNKPFKLAVTFKAELFDIPDLALAFQVAGNNLQWVSGEREWNGGLKKGNTKVMDCILMATTNGITGRCSLVLSSSTVLAALRKYAEEAVVNDVFSAEDRQYTIEWANKREAQNPIYKETSDCIVRAGR